jgi:hypothetical protein
MAKWNKMENGMWRVELNSKSARYKNSHQLFASDFKQKIPKIKFGKGM